MTISRQTKTHAIAMLVLLCGVVALWLPFPLNHLDGSDTPGQVLAAEQRLSQGLLDVIFAPHFTGRPFFYITKALGYAITPNTFVGQQIVLIAVNWLRAVFAYLLLGKLFSGISPMLRVLAGLLVTIYPGDFQFFYLTISNYQLSIVCMLAAAYLLTFIHDVRSRARFSLALGLMVLLLTLALAPFEAMHPFVAAIPVLFFVWFGWRFDPKRWLVLGVWYATQAGWAVQYLVNFAAGNSRFSGQAAFGLDVARGILQAYGYLFSSAWAFIRQGDSVLWVWAVTAALLVAGIATWQLDGESRLTCRDYGFLAVLGVGAIGLGYFPFALTPHHNFSYTHSLLISTLGAGLIVFAAAQVISQQARPRRVIAGGLTFVILALTFRTMMGAHAQYQQRFVKTHGNVELVARTAPSVKDDTFFLFLWADNAPVVRENRDPALPDDLLGNQQRQPERRTKLALEYVYHDPGTAVCIRFEDSDVGVGCRINDGVFNFVYLRDGKTFTIEQAIAFSVDREGNVLALLDEIPAGYLPASVDTSTYAPQTRIRDCFDDANRIEALYHFNLESCSN